MLLSKTKRTDLSLAEMHLTQTEPKQNNISFLSWSKILSKKDGGVIVITGHRGQGKSALGWWLAQKINKEQKKNIVAVGFPMKQEVFSPRGDLDQVEFDGLLGLKKLTRLINQAF